MISTQIIRNLTLGVTGVPVEIKKNLVCPKQVQKKKRRVFRLSVLVHPRVCTIIRKCGTGMLCNGSSDWSKNKNKIK